MSSNIEKLPINLPNNVTIKLLEGTNYKILRLNNNLVFKQFILPKTLEVELIKNKLKIKENNLGGTLRTLINNWITGLSKSFIMSYTIKGVGGKAIINQDKLLLYLGYSKPTEISIPKEIEIKLKGVNTIVGKSHSKLQLTQYLNKIKLLNKRK